MAVHQHPPTHAPQPTQKSDEYLQSRLNAPEMEELSGLLAASRADLDRRLAKPDGSGSAVVVDTKCVRAKGKPGRQAHCSLTSIHPCMYTCLDVPRALSKAMLDLALLLDERDALLKRMRAEQDVQAEVLKAKCVALKNQEKG